jgi:hypothetical protein
LRLPPEPVAVAEATPLYRPAASAPSRATEASADEDDDEDDDEAWEQIKPRRAMSATPEPDVQEDW